MSALNCGSVTRDSCELVLLSKGLAYDLAAANEALVGYGLPVNLVATRRAHVTSETALIEVPYQRLDTRSKRLLIGDTVASGASICRAIEAYLEVAPVEHVTVLSIAGAGSGAATIARFCANRGITVDFFFGLAVFGLGVNGFDLAFLHPETMASPDLMVRAHKVFQGKAISAVGWDFGSQYMAPIKYRNLCWVEAEIWGMHGSQLFQCELEPIDWSPLSGERDAFRRTHPELGF
jgi:hypothetical protein